MFPSQADPTDHREGAHHVLEVVLWHVVSKIQNNLMSQANPRLVPHHFVL